jgi:hypothetical protein
MTFPALELKLSSMRYSADSTFLTVRAYRLDDGGLDAQGQQLYVRTLRRTRSFVLAGYVDTSVILAYARQRLAEWNTEFNLHWSADRLICSL